MMDVDFYEYYDNDRFLKPYNISKILKDSNGVAYYAYIKLEREKITTILNYNLLMGILSYIKYLTLSEKFM